MDQEIKKRYVGCFLGIVTILFNPFFLLAGNISDLFQIVSPKICIIIGKDSGSLGSGVILGENSIVTNFHVVKGNRNIEVKIGDRLLKAKVVRFSEDYDLSELEISEKQSNFVTIFKESEKLKIGEEVVAIGSPLGLELTISNGIVSGVRNEKGRVLIQTNAAISPGSSGGGLFNLAGELVGITTMFLKDSQNLNFAISIDSLMTFLKTEDFRRVYAPKPDKKVSSPKKEPSPGEKIVKKNPIETLTPSEIEKARVDASHGDPKAMITMGYVYYQGLGVVKNLEIAKQFYMLSAMAGENLAMFNLSVLFGIEDNWKDALVWVYLAVKNSTDESSLADYNERCSKIEALLPISIVKAAQNEAFNLDSTITNNKKILGRWVGSITSVSGEYDWPNLEIFFSTGNGVYLRIPQIDDDFKGEFNSIFQGLTIKCFGENKRKFSQIGLGTLTLVNDKLVGKIDFKGNSGLWTEFNFNFTKREKIDDLLSLLEGSGETPSNETTTEKYSKGRPQTQLPVECRITDVKYWKSEEDCQIVINLSRKPQVSSVNTLSDGLYFCDIENCLFKPERQSSTINSKFLETFVIHEQANGSVRVFFKTPKNISQRTFLLPQNAEKPDRLVIFLAPTGNPVLATPVSP